MLERVLSTLRLILSGFDFLVSRIISPIGNLQINWVILGGFKEINNSSYKCKITCVFA